MVKLIRGGLTMLRLVTLFGGMKSVVPDEYRSNALLVFTVVDSAAVVYSRMNLRFAAKSRVLKRVGEYMAASSPVPGAEPSMNRYGSPSAYGSLSSINDHQREEMEMARSSKSAASSSLSLSPPPPSSLSLPAKQRSSMMSLSLGGDDDEDPASDYATTTGRAYHPFEINTVHRRFAQPPPETSTAFSATATAHSLSSSLSTTSSSSSSAKLGFGMAQDDIDSILQRGFGTKKAAPPVVPYQPVSATPEWARLKQTTLPFREPQFVASSVSVCVFILMQGVCPRGRPVRPLTMLGRYRSRIHIGRCHADGFQRIL